MPNDKAALRCENIRKAFGGIQALSDIDLEFPPSKIVAVIGPNGAGKTTLLNILTGFLRPDSGRCFWGEREITSLLPYQIARLGIARTFQNLRLILQESLLDNVLLARPCQRGERLLNALLRVSTAAEEKHDLEVAFHLLEFVGLKDKANNLVGELSYGEQKLLTLACCLSTEAQALLLDEPVAGVQPGMRSRILELLQQLQDKGKSIVFIEHDMQAVRQVANLIVVLDSGRIIKQGTVDNVWDQPEVMEAYLG